MYRSSYDPDNQPLFHIRGYPVRLAILLVAVHVLMLIVSASVGPRMSNWLGLVILRLPADSGMVWPDWWQWGSYFFNHAASPWFLLDMLFLAMWGLELEKIFGRRFLAVLYASLIALPSLLVAGGVASGIWDHYGMASTGMVHFCLFMAIAFLHPDAPFFIISIKVKWVAAALWTVYALGYLQRRDSLGLLIHVANTVLTYILMRRAGLTPRFERVKGAIADALPRPRRKELKPTRYQPKMVPRLEVRDDRRAVEKVDAILEKISRAGLDSLTPEERRELERASSELKRQDD
jgi:membrane associated rhomboid family serine protease